MPSVPGQSVLVEQGLPGSRSSAPDVQVPLRHVTPAPAHTRPQPPQLFVSVCGFTHVDPQAICGDVHVGPGVTHWPFMQVAAPVHALLQRPQCEPLVATFTHDAPQQVRPAAQAQVQVPLVQI